MLGLETDYHETEQRHHRLMERYNHLKTSHRTDAGLLLVAELLDELLTHITTGIVIQDRDDRGS